MHRFSRMHLSPEDAIRNLGTIDLGEKSHIAEGIALVAVIDQRRDFLAAGYSCMRNFCMGRMRMSKDKALRRIQVARAALCYPDVFECLADGRLSVTTAATLVPHLEAGTAAELLATAAFKSREEIIRMLAARSQPPAGSPVRSEPPVEAGTSPHAPVHADSHFELCAPPACASAAGSHAPVHVSSRRGRVTASATGEYEVRLAITDAEHDDLCKAQALLGHAVPSGDPAEIYARAMKNYLAHLEKQRFGTKAGAAVPVAGGRGVPKPLLRLVWERDGRRCAFVSAEGHRCEETGRLEIDHIQPVALGGKTTPENLRVLCQAHNQYEAERVLGKEHVERRRELAQRERARDKVAAEANVARANARKPARDAAQQVRYNDVSSGLGHVGFTAAEVREGAAVVDEMPDATTEECMRAALRKLSRPLILRGERMARSTA